MADYEIKHDATEQVWVVSYEGRKLGAFNTWQKAKDYVAECEGYDDLNEMHRNIPNYSGL